MSTSSSLTPASKLEAFKREAESAQPRTCHQAQQCVAEAFDVIQDQLTRKVSRANLLAAFNKAYGLQVKLPRFRQLVRAEGQRRAEKAAGADAGKGVRS